MKVFDCFMYIDEDVVLDLRLNYLNEFVDKFVIVESHYTHSGIKRKLSFDIKNFSKFKEKIIYLTLDHQPPNIQLVDESKDSDQEKNEKYILNGMNRDFYQRNFIMNGLKYAEGDDFILISDLDEIPKLEKISFSSIDNKFIFFKQRMFYYKFNLCSKSVSWVGTKCCRKKNLTSPQWLRNIKDKNYPFWRLDTFVSKNKYTNIQFIEDGGWHFSYIKKPKDIENKLKSYAHHREYDLDPIGVKGIEEKISEGKSIYDLKTDMKKSKFYTGQDLSTVEFDVLPSYLQENLDKYREWLV